jgi:hypothetical protein
MQLSLKCLQLSREVFGTHNLKDIAFFPKFEIDGYIGPAFKVGAGVTALELYQAAEAYNVTILGSIAPVSSSPCKIY